MLMSIVYLHLNTYTRSYDSHATHTSTIPSLRYRYTYHLFYTISTIRLKQRSKQFEIPF